MWTVYVRVDGTWCGGFYDPSDEFVIWTYGETREEALKNALEELDENEVKYNRIDEVYVFEWKQMEGPIDTIGEIRALFEEIRNDE